MVVNDARAGRSSPGVPLWLDDRTRVQRRPSLQSDITADVAIIGAGFTGLWAAYYLLKEDPSLKVVLLEREYAGFGASGRNGGWCSAIFPVSLGRVQTLYDRQSAINLQHAMNDTVAEVGHISTLEGIDCDFSPEGFVSLARTKAQVTRARSTVAGADAFGVNGQWRFLEAVEARGKVTAAGVLGGLYTPHCALLHPGKLVLGLASRIEDHGGVIYENTAVTSFGDGKAVTRGGTVTASVVVRATEAFTPEFPEYRRNVAPLYSLVVATEPLSEDVRATLGLVTRTAFNDMRNLRIYAHVTKDGRLVFGGRGAPYHFRSAVSPKFDVNNKIHDKIISTMEDFFPALAGTRITHRWGGPLGVPRDWFPSVGFDRTSNMAWAGPYVGDGVATSNLAGRVLRNLILNKEDSLNRLPIVDHRSKKWEIEPFRWLGVNAGLQAATVADLEESFTGKPSKISAMLEKFIGAH